MKTRVAVIGAGHLGRIHARLLNELPDAELTAIVDPDKSARTTAARENNTSEFSSVVEALPNIDAAIIAAPTTAHHSLGGQLLSQGKHVLMEKPLAITTAEAEDLVEVANRHQCVLQVGHVERFNPAFSSLASRLIEPKYIEARRSGNFSFRSLDVGVVLDLMIHDIDLVLNLTQSEVVDIQALGTSVLSGHEDMAQARLTFRNGCVANLVASRVAIHAERTMSVFCPSVFASIDFSNRTAEIVTANERIQSRSFLAENVPADQRADFSERLNSGLLSREAIDIPDCNPLQDEQRDFLSSIRTHKRPNVTGEDGRDAVAVAVSVCEAIAAHAWNGTSAGPIGPFATAGPTILSAADVFTGDQLGKRKAG